ncbi:restriction endonuclease subunit S [Flavobacterium sp. ENC]|uniref:restriction endonuclease subunit S n=1 Tax=Flavobacterium sp. ENC TaxID=2897330 RepID=UPI001E3070E7|nr:restriction endonuclease subunit S [Flavobacterium sp. ENC]MCD0467236.1 restriction endonuclease subunit S [Flavobacterium sp. ENC]
MASRGDINIDEVQPKLFDGWKKLRIEETLEKSGSFTKLKSKDYFDEGQFPVVDQGDKFISGFVNDENLLYKGELPIIIFGDHTRNVKYIDFPFATGADGTKILKPKAFYNSKFYHYYFKSLKVPNLGYSRHFSILKEIEFPLPQLAEQNRIVVKLDRLFAQLEAIKTSLKTIPLLLKDFRQKVLTEAVTGKLTEEWRKAKKLDEWKNEFLNNICNSITDGDHQAPPQVSEGVPFLVISNVSKGYFEFEKVSRFVPKEYFNSLKDSRKPKTGDILYTVTGSYGIPLLVDFEKEFCFQRHIAILRPDNNKILSSFLKFSLQSDLMLSQAHNVATGTAQLTVPLGGIKRFEINLPSLAEQQEIVRRVESVFTKADTIEEQYKSLKAQIDTLPQSILHKAFKGELTEQLDSDGDARELLEEIKTLKSEIKKKSK